MRTDQYGCEIVERRPRRGRTWRAFFFGTAMGFGLLFGVSVSGAVFSPEAGAEASTVWGTLNGIWHGPEAVRGNLARSGARVPNLVAAELEIWHRVNQRLASVLPN